MISRFLQIPPPHPEKLLEKHENQKPIIRTPIPVKSPLKYSNHVLIRRQSLPQLHPLLDQIKHEDLHATSTLGIRAPLARLHHDTLAVAEPGGRVVVGRRARQREPGRQQQSGAAGAGAPPPHAPRAHLNTPPSRRDGQLPRQTRAHVRQAPQRVRDTGRDSRRAP